MASLHHPSHHRTSHRSQYKCDENDSDCIAYYIANKIHNPTMEVHKLQKIIVKCNEIEKKQSYWKKNPTITVYYVTYTIAKYTIANKQYPDTIHRKILLVNSNGWIQGEFIIITHKNNFDFTKMEIHINDESNKKNKYKSNNYQKKGLSYVLIYYMIISLQRELPSILNEKQIFVAGDSSGNFWAMLGMRDNPVYNSKNEEIEGRGYEKVITFGEMKHFVEKNKEKIDAVLMHRNKQRTHKKKSLYQHSAISQTRKSSNASRP